MTEGIIVQLPKSTEKILFSKYDNMIQVAIEKALEDRELYIRSIIYNIQ